MPAVEIYQDKWHFESFKILTNSKERVNTENRKLIIWLSRVKTPSDGYDNDGDDLWCWDLNLVPHACKAKGLPQEPHGVSAKRLKSLALNKVLGALKVFTGEMNIIIVALVFSTNELHTQEQAKRHGKESEQQDARDLGMLRPPQGSHGRVHRQGSGYPDWFTYSWVPSKILGLTL